MSGNNKYNNDALICQLTKNCIIYAIEQSYFMTCYAGGVYPIFASECISNISVLLLLLLLLRQQFTSYFNFCCNLVHLNLICPNSLTSISNINSSGECNGDNNDINNFDIKISSVLAQSKTIPFIVTERSLECELLTQSMKLFHLIVFVNILFYCYVLLCGRQCEYVCHAGSYLLIVF